MRTKVILTTNLLVAKGRSSKFDHPADIDDIKKELDHRFLDSLTKLRIPKNTDVIAHALVVGTAKLTQVQKASIENFVRAFNEKIETHVFYPSTLLNLITDLRAQKLCDIYNYSKIRNTAFVLGTIYGADLLIQVDTDQYIPRDYLLKAMETYHQPGVHCWSGFYNEEGSKTTPACDPLDIWPKFSAMVVDASRLLAKDKLQPTIFAKGGNMLFKRDYFTNICYPTRVARGEDFALALRSWLIYHNGNPKADIEPLNPKFKTYLDPSDDATVIHYTKHKALLNFLPYLERNLMRFAVERATFYDQSRLSYQELANLSTYMSRMILEPNASYSAYIKKIYSALRSRIKHGRSKAFTAQIATNPVYCSLRGSIVRVQKLPYYPPRAISNSERRVLNLIKGLRGRHLFDEYLDEQKRYIKLIAGTLKNRRTLYQQLCRSSRKVSSLRRDRSTEQW